MRQLLRFVKRCLLQGLAFAGQFRGCRVPRGAQFLCDDDCQIFFGYYDVTPFSGDGSYVLAGRTSLTAGSPHECDVPLELGIYDLNKPQPAFQKFAEAKSWNWQQGARLQWMPGVKDCAFYNDFDGARYGGVLFDIVEGRVIKHLSVPLYAISPDGARGLTLDFSRLHRLRRGYGYHNITRDDLLDPFPADDGVYLYDFDADTSALIVSLKDLALFDPEHKTDSYINYVNHLDFNPSGDVVMFFHLFQTEAGKRRVRLFTCDLDGGGLKYMKHDIRPSHYCWRDDQTLLVTGQDSGGRVCYVLYDIVSGSVSEVAPGALDEDGHPSFISGDLIISDTYPDMFGHQTLFTCDLRSGEKNVFFTHHHPLVFRGEGRCDFHPRLSPGKDKVCVDTVRNGKRCMVVMPLPVTQQEKSS
jgi:hypothetical protein